MHVLMNQPVTLPELEAFADPVVINTSRKFNGRLITVCLKSRLTKDVVAMIYEEAEIGWHLVLLGMAEPRLQRSPNVLAGHTGDLGFRCLHDDAVLGARCLEGVFAFNVGLPSRQDPAIVFIQQLDCLATRHFAVCKKAAANNISSVQLFALDLQGVCFRTSRHS